MAHIVLLEPHISDTLNIALNYYISFFKISDIALKGNLVTVKAQFAFHIFTTNKMHH